MISGLLFSQTENEPYSGNLTLQRDQTQSGTEEQKWSLVNIGLDAGGFLATGPVLEINFRVAEKSYLGLFYVNHYLGLLSSSLIFGEDFIHFSSKGMGAGLAFKHYFLPTKKMNALYAGLYLGYSYNEAVYHYGYPNEGVEKLKDILLFGSGGYRWNVGKRLYVLTGVQFGIAYTFDDKYFKTYSFDEATGTLIKNAYLFEEYNATSYPYGLPEITLGIKF